MAQKSPTDMDSMLAQVNATRMETLTGVVKPEEVAKIPSEKLNDEIAKSFSAPKPESSDEYAEKPEVKPDVQQKPVEIEVKPEEKPEFENIFDDYGNETPKPSSKTYTEDEVSERINAAVRERLARLEKNNPPANVNRQAVQKAEEAGFNYDPDSGVDWQQQLKAFIKQTNEETRIEEARAAEQKREMRAIQEFEDKFHSGMAKFSDFRDVVGHLPITDSMTMATRAMKDPAAFLYAAAKRHSSELQRISQINDPYTQMVEMGRLEERMKKSPPTTQAPKPFRVTREDVVNEEPREVRAPTIEDLIAQNDRGRLNRMRGRI